MPSNTVLEMSVISSIVLILLLPLASTHGIGVVLNTDFGINQETKSFFSEMSKMSVLDLMTYYVEHESQRNSGRTHQHKFHQDGRPTKSHNKKSHSDDQYRVQDLDNWATRRNTFDHVNSWNELFRRKRSTQCSWPRLIKESVKHLNQDVNVESIFRLYSENNVNIGTSILSGDSYKTSSPKCSTSVIERDLGLNIFPRYIRDVKCNSVIDSSCHDKTQNVTVYRQVGCRNGEAVLTTVRMTANIAVCSNNQDV